MSEQFSSQLLSITNIGPDTAEKRALLPFIHSLDGLFTLEIEDRQYLLEEWCPTNSIGMVFAKRGVGKSWFCMCLAIAISERHKTICGWNIHEHGPILYVDGEMTLSDIRNRFSLLSDRSSPNEDLLILPSETLFRDSTPVRIDEPGEKKAIMRLLKELTAQGKRPKLIILDNLSTLRGAGSDENSNSDEEPLMAWLNELRHEGYAVLVVHHAGKKGDQRGASKKEDLMDYVIQLEAPDAGPEQGAAFKLSFTKIRAKRPTPDVIDCKLVEDATGKLHLANSVSNDAEGKKLRILRQIAEFPPYENITQVAVGKKCGIPKQTVSPYVAALRIDDLLEPKGALKLTKFGWLVLHETWPKEFPCPEGLKPGMRKESPF